MIDPSFRARLKAGEPLLGAFVNIESPTAVEVLAVAGMDFLMIDGEHAPIGPANAVEMVRAAEARRISILARGGGNTQQVMAKYLDAGVIGTMTPMVSSAAEARRVVDSVKYPPVGKRGLAGVRINDFVPDPGYVATANEATVVVVQIETRTGIDRADEIVATDGVDVVFLGPSDLSVALGVPGQTKHPSVLETIEALTGKIVAAGKAAGTVTRSAEDYQYWRKRGVQVFLNSAGALLLGAASRFLEESRAAEQTRP
ncbi:MAG: aldolase/citrate lyase family protein [Gammaproteobacteria bacterium]|nr:aldolase/citrate lyase family protein [Gammaproteobacteria bacterium]